MIFSWLIANHSPSNFEWADGYETRFGVTFVDYKDDQKRYLKKSGKCLKSLIEQYVKKTNS